MKILLSNDDGIHSEGLEVLLSTLTDFGHDVIVFAPDANRSAVSHGISLHEPLHIKKIRTNYYSCSGKPADCILAALIGYPEMKPDMVLAGVNHGPNLGTDILYSGTAAAARQASLMKVPGVALSICSHSGPYFWKTALQLIGDNLQKLKKDWADDFFWNINFPNSDDINGIRWMTEPSRRVYHDKMTKFDTPFGSQMFFLTGDLDPDSCTPESDWDVVNKGSISVSKILIHPQTANREGDFG